MKPSRTIVLVHGFGASRGWMRTLQRFFESQGHTACNWGYRSLFQPIHDHAESLTETLRDMDADPDVATIDFVTHSMGCIVMRASLSERMPTKRGRWVMLAPPNRGSYLANVLAPVFGRVMQPLRELRTTPDSYVNQLPSIPGIDIGMIQASMDYIVAPSRTVIEGEVDRVQFRTLHSTLLLREDVARQCLHFLVHGNFSPQSNGAT